jgi:molybdate transport system regulatory protein
MKPKIHVMLCDDIGERFFGEGPCRLLHRIEETGSLRAAAQAMGLSYSKALRMVKRAEKELGFALTRKTIGGRGGGGSNWHWPTSISTASRRSMTPTATTSATSC